MNPWTLELLIARLAERRALARDADRGLVVRIRPGVYVERTAFDGMHERNRHIVRMRALDAVSDEPPVFSLWSAALVQGLPTIGDHLRRVHVSVADPSLRGLVGVDAHVAVIEPGEVVQAGPLRVTSVARTVTDVALVSPFRGGVVVADGALHVGTSRQDLEEAIALASDRGRRGVRRGQQVVAFADGGAESANESQARVSHCELGIEPPVLQQEIRDEQGRIGLLDFGYRRERAGGEADGDTKYLDPRFAPAGAGAKVVAEKRREDRMRRRLDGFARWGYRESCTPALLAPILAGIRVVPVRATLADYCRPFLHERLSTSARIRDT